MKSKRVINAEFPCIGTQVPDNHAKNLLVFFSTMASAPVPNVTSNKYIILSQGTCSIHDNKCNR